MARYLKVDEFGIINFSISLTTIFLIFTDLGLSNLATLEIARNKTIAPKYFSNILIIKLILSIFYFIAICFILIISNFGVIIKYAIIIISISIAISGFNNFFYSVFQGFEKFKYQSFGLIINNIIMLIGIVIVINYNYGLIEIAFTYFITSIIIIIYTLYNIYKLKIVLIKTDLDFSIKIIKCAIPFGLTYIFVTIFYNISPIILLYFKGETSVGLYSASYRLITIILLIPGVLNIVIFPLLSRTFLISKNILLNIIYQYFKFMFIISIPIILIIILISEKLIIFIYGHEYIDSVIILKIMVISTIFVFLNSAYIKYLEASNRQFIVTKIVCISIVISLIMNIILTYHYGYIGSSISLILNELITFIIYIIICTIIYKEINIKNVYILSLKIITVSFISFIFTIIFKENILIMILLYIIIYLILLNIFGVITKKDWNILKNLLSF
jgi:O-antigen/teichoic acid export membrane protein